MSSGSERKTGKAKVEGSPSGRDSGRNGEERSSPGDKSGRIIEIKTVLRIMIVVLLSKIVFGLNSVNAKTKDYLMFM